MFGAKALERQQGLSATRTTLGIKAAFEKVDSGNLSPDARCDYARTHWLMNCFAKSKDMKRRHKVGWCIFGGPVSEPDCLSPSCCFGFTP